MVRGDLSLIANINGTELLIFPSDKLPERIQRKFIFANVIVPRKDCSLPRLRGLHLTFYRLEWFSFLLGHFLCPESK